MHPHIQQSSLSLSQHSYGTRIRRNSILKPSVRLRQCPRSSLPPRRIKPVPLPAPLPAPLSADPGFPIFPIPGVMLHPEDASNKVFHAIGRSFLSVENRAMTIKDLAEITLKYGLMCQNVSAASQAITTYIRNHMARCEAQQDHPLLLRHILSGTPADDDLVPALYSRIGGATNSTKPTLKDPGLNDKNIARIAEITLDGERLTNFRRGTMVWYLSKATGVSCPFARAGIRLCEYGKEGRKIAEEHGDESPPEPKKHVSEAQCGEKRKRLRRGCRRDSDGSWGCFSAGLDSENPAIDSADFSDDERPPKVKLTLRLRPPLATTSASRPREVIDLSSDTPGSLSEGDASADDHDDVDMYSDPPEVPRSLPPNPHRSISLPHYTATCSERPVLSFSDQHAITDERRRSPPTPCSASPPPDSDHDDFDLDLDSDIDWDSSSLSLPSPAPVPQVKVETTDDLQPFRPEPANVRDMLDAWEDLDCAPMSTISLTTAKIPTTDDFKFGPLDLWEWEFESGWTGISEDHQDLPVVKMEPGENVCPASIRAFSPTFPVSPHTSFAPSSRHSSFSPFSEPDVGSLTLQSPVSPFTLSTSPSSLSTESERRSCALTWQDVELLGPDSVHPHEFEDEWSSGVKMHVDCNLLPKRASGGTVSSPSSCEPEQDKTDDTHAMLQETETCHEPTIRPSHSSSISVAPDTVVVQTCRPCTPDICATQIEGISVYQAMLDSTPLLRRIDTDFVNLSTILSHLSRSPPSPLPDGCVYVSHPSLSIDGIWAPLSVARLYSRGLPRGIDSIFLSDDLVMRFPTALQDFYQSNTSGRSLNHFGPNFSASLPSPEGEHPLNVPTGAEGRSSKAEVWEVFVEGGLEDHLLFIPPAVNRALAALHPSPTTTVVVASPEAPLSPTEQEIFRALCVHADWDSEEVGIGGDETDALTKHGPGRETPLRRSRRVADAVAARSRAVPPRTKGPRHT